MGSEAVNEKEELEFEIIDTHWNLASLDGHDDLVGHFVRRDAPSYGIVEGEYFVEVLLDNEDNTITVTVWEHEWDYYEPTEIDYDDVEVEEIVDVMDALWDKHAESYEEAVEED